MLENSNKIINYTIIIPHKNIPELLNRCLKSIPNREDLEIIIVDDNSSPDIVDFNNFPGQSRQNTKIIFNKNPKGAGHARNLALPYVRGKWVIFADADDFFTQIFPSKLDYYKNNDSDLIIFSANCVDTDTYENSNRAYYLTNLFDIYDKNKKEGEILLKYKFCVPWSRFIKAKVIKQNNLRFDEIVMCNDEHFIYLTSFYSQKVIFDRQAVYCVTTRLNSISQNKDINAILGKLEVLAEKSHFLRKNGIHFLQKNIYSLLIYFLFNNRNAYKQGIKILKRYNWQKIHLYVFKYILLAVLSKVFNFIYRLMKRILSYGYECNYKFE